MKRRKRRIVVGMSEITFMAPTITDRMHYFLFSDLTDFPKLGESKLEDSHLKRITMHESDFSVEIYQRGVGDDSSSFGFIVPNKESRQKYFRLALIAFMAGVLWMLIVGITLIGWTIAAILAVFGINFLMVILEPIGPFILPIFAITSILASIPILFMVIYFPIYNRNLASRAEVMVKEYIKSVIPDVNFRDIEINTRIWDYAIGKRLPDSFRMKIEENLKYLKIPDGIDTIAYTFIEKP